MKQFSFVAQTVKVVDTQIHSILESMGYNNQPDEFIKRDFDYFNYYDKPVAVFEDGKYNILTQALDYNLIVESGQQEIDIYVSNFDDEFNTRRFIGFRHAMNTADRKAQYETIRFLKAHSETQDGKGFFESISGADINDKIGVLMGTSGRTIKRVKQVGDKAPEFLSTITTGENTFQHAFNEIKKRGIMETAAANPKKKHKVTFLNSVLKELILDCSDPDSPYAMINGKEFGSLELKSSVEIKDGNAIIKFVDSIAKGLEIKIEIKHLAASSVVAFNKKKDEEHDNVNLISDAA